jgi:hypothetical protein
MLFSESIIPQLINSQKIVYELYRLNSVSFNSPQLVVISCWTQKISSHTQGLVEFAPAFDHIQVRVRFPMLPDFL